MLYKIQKCIDTGVIVSGSLKPYSEWFSDAGWVCSQPNKRPFPLAANLVLSLPKCVQNGSLTLVLES